MKFVLILIGIFILATTTQAQSGRRGQTIVSPVPPPAEVEAPKEPTQPAAATVRAQRNEDYQCTEDGSLARALDSEEDEKVDTSKKLDSHAVITSKPAPSYTREARRSSIQGFVTLKVLLSRAGKITRIRVLKGLPAGLTENAIRAACKIKFKPAIKDGQPVSRWVTAEYVFRLAESSIFGP
jgi:protein TonB